jgi:hypothetical protein
MFKKLFGLKRSTPRIESNRKFDDLFLEYGADSLHKQYAAADYLGEHSWNFDLKTGLISFSRERTFPFQLLGSESEYDGTWMWAWANPVSNINETLTQSSRRLREFGAANGIDEFCQPKFECKEINGHLLSMVASGVCKAHAYYRCPYDGGAAFILVDFGGDLPDEFPLLLRMHGVFTDFISSFDVMNQRAAFASYARLRGVRTTDDGTDLLLSLGNEPVGVARFDDLNRLVHLETEIQPSMQPG